MLANAPSGAFASPESQRFPSGLSFVASLSQIAFGSTGASGTKSIVLTDMSWARVPQAHVAFGSQDAYGV